jgi:hypothetical protein
MFWGHSRGLMNGIEKILNHPYSVKFNHPHQLVVVPSVRIIPFLPILTFPLSFAQTRFGVTISFFFWFFSRSATRLPLEL